VDEDETETVELDSKGASKDAECATKVMNTPERRPKLFRVVQRVLTPSYLIQGVCCEQNKRSFFTNPTLLNTKSSDIIFIIIHIPFFRAYNGRDNGERAKCRGDRRFNFLCGDNVQLIMTSFHAAANNGDLQRVRALVNRGEFIDAQTSDRWTALHRAVASQREDVVRFLVDNGANCNIRNNDGRTPLHHAAMKDNVLILLLLVEGHAELNPKDVSYSFKKFSFLL
jgi:hypothetical protein